MFRYNVSKDDFTEMSIYVMKQKSARLSAKVKLVLFTVVQMAVIAWLIFRPSEVSPLVKVLMGIASLIWAFQTFFSYGCYKARAKMMLTNQKDNDPNGDFWKEHRLQLKDGKVDIAYGDSKASLECAQITGTDETEHLTLLMSGKNIFEIVPKSVSEKDSFKAFLDEIRGTAAQKLKAAQEKQRKAAVEDPIFLEYLDLTEDEVAEELVRIKRASFLRVSGWSKVTFLVFAVPLLILILCLALGSWLYALVAFVFFLLTNAGTLMIFTPLYKNVTRKQVQPAGEGGYLLTVADGGAHLFTREYHYRYMISDLRDIIRGKDADYYIFAGQQMLFVPASCRDAFKKAMTKSHSLSQLSHMGSGSAGEEEKG